MSQQHILQAQRLLAQARYKNNGHINQGRGLLKTMAWVGPMAESHHYIARRAGLTHTKTTCRLPT